MTHNVGGLSLAQAQRATREALQKAGLDSAAIDARLLLEAACRLDRAAVLAAPETILSCEQQKTLASLTERRLRREPMAYILGSREFRSLDFITRPGALIPRPDTETLVEAVLAAAPDARNILDMGVGSGCILLSLLKALPQAQGLGADRSETALALARENARRLNLSGRALLVASDWGAAISGQFDLVVSNPPYIPEEEVMRLDPDVRDFEPALALDGGPDGLDCYRTIIGQLPQLLRPGGWAGLEIGWDQAVAVQGLLAAVGLKVISVNKDMAGRDRAVLARLP